MRIRDHIQGFIAGALLASAAGIATAQIVSGTVSRTISEVCACYQPGETSADLRVDFRRGDNTEAGNRTWTVNADRTVVAPNGLPIQGFLVRDADRTALANCRTAAGNVLTDLKDGSHLNDVVR